MFTLLLSSIILTFLALFYVYITRNRNYWKKRSVVGPEPTILYGTYPKSSKNEPGYNFLVEADEIFLKYYKKHRFVGTLESSSPVLMITDPSLARDVLITNFKNFAYNTLTDKVHVNVDPLFGRNPFFRIGEDWKRLRGEISPAFTMLKLKPMYPIVAEISNRLVKYISENADNGENAFQTKELSRRFTGDVICNCIFGFDSKSFEDLEIFINSADHVFIAPPHLLFLTKILSYFPFIQHVIKLNLTNKESNNWFIEMSRQAADARKKSGIQRDDYLNFVLELQSKSDISLEDIAGHLFTFFLDGYETSSHFLAGGLNLLSKNPNVQRKLRNEISTYDDIDYETLNQLPYLDNVFHEILRLTPFPFPLWKKCTEDFEVTDYDGTVVKIEKGIDVLLPMTSIHNHPDIYVEPAIFNPNRFDESNGGSKRFKDLGALMPFGNGPRICLGMRFAITQIKAALVGIIKNFEIIQKVVKDDVNTATNSLFITDNKTIVGFKKINTNSE